MLVGISTIEALLPRELDEREKLRLKALITQAEEIIRVAFLKARRDFDEELETVPWLKSEAQRIIVEMVSAATLVGSNVGVRSASSTTGPQSDSVTYADVNSVSWGGIKLTDEMLAALGLTRSGARGVFPCPPGWPEWRLWHGRDY